MLSRPDPDPSPFEGVLKGIEDPLDSNFRVKTGTNLVDNVGALHHLVAMNKFELESFLCRRAIITLNDEEYGRLQAKIRDLLSANETAAREQGIDLNFSS